MTTANITITSKTNIVYPNSLELYQSMVHSSYKTQAMAKEVLYRHYIFSNDNITGDRDYAEYEDYLVFAEIQIDSESKDITTSGYINSSFGFMYLPSEIRVNTNSDDIASFRPQMLDEVKYQGKWYRIENMQPLHLTQKEFSMECTIRYLGENDIDR